MRIRLLFFSGRDDRNQLLEPGATLDVSEDLARELIRRGRACLPERQIETAEIAPPENAARTHKPIPRGSRRSFSPKKG